MMSETYTLTRDQLETVLRSTYAAGEQAGESPLSAAGDERRFRRAIDAAVARAAEYTARKPTNETTPDAVERQYQDIDGNPCDLATLCRREPGWAANRIDTLLAERARHAEELRKVEGERDAERKHATEMEERALDLVRDLRLAQVELHALRSLLPDGGTDALARAWEEGAEAAFDAQDPGPDSDYIRPLFGRALDEFYASNPYRTKGVGDE